MPAILGPLLRENRPACTPSYRQNPSEPATDSIFPIDCFAATLRRKPPLSTSGRTGELLFNRLKILNRPCRLPSRIHSGKNSIF